VVRAGESLHKVKGSKHLGHTMGVETEEEIKQHLDALWKAHHGATHVSYAWRLGADKARYRANDDGEPAGTAGQPILGQIKSMDVTNVLVAVVRYYGGTNLGTGGLIDAYGTAARMALEAATIAERRVMCHYRVEFGYGQMPAVMRLLKAMDAEITESVFDNQCSLRAGIARGDAARWEAGWADLRLSETASIKPE